MPGGGAGPHRRGARTPLPDTPPARQPAQLRALHGGHRRPGPRPERGHTVAETQQSVQPCERDPERDPECTWLARALRGTLDSTGLGRRGREGSMGAPLCGPGRRRQLCARSLHALCTPASGPATREEVGVSPRSWSLAVVLAHLTPLAQESWIQSKETQNPKKWVCPQTHHFTISSTSRDQEINNKVTRVWQPQAWSPPTWGFPSSG